MRTCRADTDLDIDKDSSDLVLSVVLSLDNMGHKEI